MTDCAILRFRVLLLVLWLLSAASPAARSAAAAADEKSPPVKTESDSDSATKAEDASKADPAQRRSEEEYFELFRSLADTIDQVDRNYVKPIDRREIMEAAIKGILTKLDPYSSYIDPAEIGSFRTAVESQFGGIGIQVTMDRGRLTVSSPLVGSPAYHAGVMAGDRITKIEGESTRGMSRDDAVQKLKGEVGTKVTFTVQHALTGETETFTLDREIVHVDTVMGDTRKLDDSWNFMLDPEKRIGYIRLAGFSRDTAADLRKALEDLQRQKLRGLVLDLRFNPGGLLTSAVEVCNMFVSEGRIVSTKGRNTQEKVWDAVKGGQFEGFPIAILVNHYSASASEIVSACLQDHHRAVIVGDRTWGKGSVQNVIELEDGKSALKLTTATYTRPNGHNIHRFEGAKDSDEWGVKPDPGWEVRLDDAEMNMLLADRYQRDLVSGKAHEKKSDTTTDQSGAEGQKETASSSGKYKIDVQVQSKGDDSTKQKPTAVSSKFVDRQLQRALEYLSTELARAN
jgi:carboxyl-terminal processing protease